MKTSIKIERFRITPADPCVMLTFRTGGQVKTIELGEKQLEEIDKTLKSIVMKQFKFEKKTKQFGKDNGAGGPVVTTAPNGPGGPKTSR